MIAALLSGCLCGAFGQSDPPARVFEVASVRVGLPPFTRLYDISMSGPRFTAGGCTVRELVMYAYNLKNYQVSMPASFSDSETRYDIVAKAEGNSAPAKDEFRQMVRSLLADRFKLKGHREMKEMPVYALVVGKNGPNLKESKADAQHDWFLGVSGRNYQVTMRNVMADEVVSAIANAFLDRPIVDKTGLTRTYDANLTYTPNLRANREADPDLNEISIFDAVQKLGLKLEPQKAMVEIFAVDYAEKPSQN